MNKEPFESPSIKSHRNQRFWQIFLPIILISLLVISFGSYYIVGGTQTRVWADISIIWISLPILMILLFSFAILVGMIVLMVQAAQKLPLLTRKVQRLFCLMEKKSIDATDSVLKPIFWINQMQAGIARIFKRTTR